MRDIDTLIRTLSAYQRLKLTENEHKKPWELEEQGELILGMHREWNEFFIELSKPSATSTSIWSEAADIANYVSFLADREVKKRFKEAESKDQITEELPLNLP